MPRVKRNQGVRSGRGQKNLAMVVAAVVAVEPSTVAKKRGLRLKTVSTCTMVLALSFVFAFPSMRDQVTGKSASPRSIYRTAQRAKAPGRSSWVANSKT
jgi:hypothetical protein